jgi:hypothetical protein
MGKLTVEIGTRRDLSSVSKEELMASTFSLLQILEILFLSSRGKCECDISCGVIDWTGKEEEINLVEKSMVWAYIEPMWLYTEKGFLTPKLQNLHIEDIIGDLVKWLSSVESISEYCGEITQIPIIKVLTKYLARIKLDFDIDFSTCKDVPYIKGLYSGQDIYISWLPQVDAKYLTIVEMALLAGTSNIRSVRNAQYDKDNPLQFFKKGKKVLVKVEVARHWLNQRRGFVTTNIINDDDIIH